MNDLRGKSAVVTGGGSGIGAAIARRLEQAGARVVTIDKDPETRPTVVADMSGDDTAELAGRLVSEHGPFDLIVNNVGISPGSSFLELEQGEWDLVFRTNLRGPWFFTKRLVEELIAAGRGGSILFISSLHDTYISLTPHYSASKAAVAMLVKELAWELAPHKIRVNALSPGGIHTRPGPPSGRTRAPWGIGMPEDIAPVAAALLSEEISGYVTGANVPVDGGLALYTWMTS